MTQLIKSNSLPTAKTFPSSPYPFFVPPTHLFLWVLLATLLLFPLHLSATPTVLILGDSLTAGYGIEKDQAFPALLEKELLELGFPKIKVINAGFSGSTSASAVKRFKWYLKLKPDLLILELGANDGLRGHQIEAIKANLSQTIQLALSKNIKVLLAGMKMPRNYGKDYTRRFEGLYAELAKEHSVPMIPFILEGVAADPGLNLADGIHPNPEGHKIIAKTVLKHLLPLLK